MDSQDPALGSFREDIIEGGHDETLDNHERGCGFLEPGKGYVRGVPTGPGGHLPTFVTIDPPLPYREIGTDGSFTRGYESIAGVTIEKALAYNGYEFEPHAPGGYEPAFDKMVESGMYGTRVEIPEHEIDRHLDRIAQRELMGSHWGEMDITGHTDLLMRAGKTHYPEPDDYIEEAIEMGISKAIPISQRQEPPTVIPGITRCWIMHPEAGDDDAYGGAIIGYAYIGEVVFTMPEEGEPPEFAREYERNGALRIAEIGEEIPAEEEDDEHTKMADFIDDN